MDINTRFTEQPNAEESMQPAEPLAPKPRVVALIDGEHYPPVVRFALQELSAEADILAVAFVGGTEKVDLDAGLATYGVDVVVEDTPANTVRTAIRRYRPEQLVDLSDEPILTAGDRFSLASIALLAGVEYRGADFHFIPPDFTCVTNTPTLGIIGTGKRVGKTSVSAYIAREIKAAGIDPVVLAMGRGGPDTPELIRGDEVELTTPDLLALARQGKHASSDNYEGAVMSRVTTVGCRRCGGGLAGKTFFSNVVAGAELADTLGKDLMVLEGSGAAIPPVRADANVLIVGAGRGIGYVRDHFGPYRVALADLIIISSAEEPNATPEQVAALREEIHHLAPDVPVIVTTFRPKPLAPVAGRKVFFATTAPAMVLPALVQHLEDEYGCTVVGASPHLSNRSKLRVDLKSTAEPYDLLLTELKAAAIDVVAEAGDELGIETVLCDNVPITDDGTDLAGAVVGLARGIIGSAHTRRCGPE